MPPLLASRIAEKARAFAAGFVLGAAFMASPALGLALAVIAAGVLLIGQLKG